MAKISDVDVVRALKAANWPSTALIPATAVVLGEHRGSVDPTVVSPPNDDGSRDHGLMSINDKAHPEKIKSGNPYNAIDNARMGLDVYREAGNSFGPWTVYPGISSLYQPRAAEAVQKVSGEASEAPTDSLATGKDEGIWDAHWWLRAALVASGVVLLLVLASQFLSSTKVPAAVAKVAKVAHKVEKVSYGV